MANLEQELSGLVNQDPDTLKGTLGLNSSTVKVSNRPGYVWVRMLDNPNEVVKAYNNAVSPTYNLPVIMSYNGRRYEVVKIDIDRYENWPSSYIPYHGKQHSAERGHEGQDIVWVDSQQFLPLLVVPSTATGTNMVNVFPYFYQDSAGAWSMVGGTGVGNFSSLDVTGSTLYLVMLNDTTKELYSITGSVISANITGTRSVIANAPHIPSAQVKDSPLALVKVRPNHQISWRDIYDLRRIIHPITNSSASPSVYIDLTDQITGGNTHYDLPSYTESIQVFKGGLGQSPTYPTLDGDKLGFTIPDTLPTGTTLYATLNPTTGIDNLYPPWVSVSPDNPPDPPNVIDDEFIGSILDANWTTYGAGSPIFTLSDSVLNISEEADSQYLKGIERTISGAAWKCRTHCFMESCQADYNGLGFSIKNNANSRYEFFGLIFHSAYGFLIPYNGLYTNCSTVSSVTYTVAWVMGQSWFLELEYDGTDFILRHSSTGKFYSEIIRYAQASWIAANPTHIGLCAHHLGPRIDASFDWFRRIA